MEITYHPAKNGWKLKANVDGTSAVFSGVFDWKRILNEKLLGQRKLKNTLKDSVDVYSLFSSESKKIWNRTYKIAKKQRQKKVGCTHLFLSLLEDSSVKEIFFRLSSSTEDAKVLMESFSELTPANIASEELKLVPFQAFAESIKLHDKAINPLMLLAAIIITVPHEHVLQAIFSNVGLSLEKLEVLSVWLLELNYNFEKDTPAENLLRCCQKIRWIELHNKLRFRLSTIEKALAVSGQNPQKALRLLVHTADEAKKKNLSIVSSLAPAI